MNDEQSLPEGEITQEQVNALFGNDGLVGLAEILVTVFFLSTGVRYQLCEN